MSEWWCNPFSDNDPVECDTVADARLSLKTEYPAKVSIDGYKYTEILKGVRSIASTAKKAGTGAHVEALAFIKDAMNAGLCESAAFLSLEACMGAGFLTPLPIDSDAFYVFRRDDGSTYPVF